MMQNLQVRKKIVKNFLYINIYLTSKIRNVLGHPVIDKICTLLLELNTKTHKMAIFRFNNTMNFIH